MIQELARKLASALKESPENKNFQAARQKVLADKKAEKLITDLRARQFELSALQMQGKKPDQEKVKALEKLAQEAQANPTVKAYFEAEARLGQLWTEVQGMLARAVGMEEKKR